MCLWHPTYYLQRLYLRFLYLKPSHSRCLLLASAGGCWKDRFHQGPGFLLWGRMPEGGAALLRALAGLVALGSRSLVQQGDLFF